MENTVIQTTRPRPSSFQSLYAHRDLLVSWTNRILRARYQQSFLGALWAIIQPAATVIIFTIIFTQIIPIKTGAPSYALFSFAAMVPWTFFTSSLTDMVDSLVTNMNLVTKVYFPREILPLAAMLARFVDFLLAGVMLGILMFYYRSQIPSFPQGWLFLPVIILVQMALMFGLGLIGSALNVFYRDVKHVFSLGLQLWLYASPILYPLDKIPPRFQSLYSLNPMVGIISAYRDVLIFGKLPDYTLFISAAMSLVILSIGYWFFKRVEFQFADVV